MSKIFTFIGRIGDACSLVGIRIAEIALLLLMLMTVYAVVSRYVFNSPSVHASEVSVYLLVVTTWAAVGWVHTVDQHVCMEAFSGRLKGGWKRLANLVSQIAVVVFCVILVWAGVWIAMENFEKGSRSASLLEFPMWIPFALIPVGGGVLGMVAFSRLKSQSKQEV